MADDIQTQIKTAFDSAHAASTHIAYIFLDAHNIYSKLTDFSVTNLDLQNKIKSDAEAQSIITAIAEHVSKLKAINENAEQQAAITTDLHSNPLPKKKGEQQNILNEATSIASTVNKLMAQAEELLLKVNQLEHQWQQNVNHLELQFKVDQINAIRNIDNLNEALIQLGNEIDHYYLSIDEGEINHNPHQEELYKACVNAIKTRASYLKVTKTSNAVFIRKLTMLEQKLDPAVPVSPAPDNRRISTGTVSQLADSFRNPSTSNSSENNSRSGTPGPAPISNEGSQHSDSDANKAPESNTELVPYEKQRQPIQKVWTYQLRDLIGGSRSGPTIEEPADHAHAALTISTPIQSPQPILSSKARKKLRNNEEKTITGILKNQPATNMARAASSAYTGIVGFGVTSAATEVATDQLSTSDSTRGNLLPLVIGMTLGAMLTVLFWQKGRHNQWSDLRNWNARRPLASGLMHGAAVGVAVAGWGYGLTTNRGRSDVDDNNVLSVGGVLMGAGVVMAFALTLWLKHQGTHDRNAIRATLPIRVDALDSDDEERQARAPLASGNPVYYDNRRGSINTPPAPTTNQIAADNRRALLAPSNRGARS